jgi:endonuclease/exonuclease/phosphatase family metal-dependent hydrolase
MNTHQASRIGVAFLLCCCWGFGAPSQAGDQIKIGFWDIRDFSAASRDATELGQIAKVAHDIDCLAIAELNDGTVLGKLKSKLKQEGGKWKYVQTSAKVGNTPSTSEQYGFVYRPDKLKRWGTPRVLDEITYSVANEANRRFDREPFVCSFRTLDNRFDFTVIAVHCTWGKKAAYREGEVRALKEYFTQVQDHGTGDDDVILCGDFNQNVGDPDSIGHLLTISGMVDTTDPNTPTKIDTSNTYDHLLMQTTFTTEYTGNHGTIAFDETMFDDDDELASAACSDHRPVWAECRVPSTDDD